MNAVEVLRTHLNGDGIRGVVAADAALDRLARLVEAATEVRMLWPAYVSTIPLSSEVCTSMQKDDYFAAVRRYDKALADVLGEEFNGANAGC